MKINVEKLTNFLKKATIDAKINTATLFVANNEMTIKVRSADNISAAVSKLRGLTGDEKLNLPIKNTKFLLDTLKLFAGEVEMKVVKNILSIYNKERQVDIVLAAEDYVENNLDKDINLVYEKTATITAEVFKNAVRNMGVVKSDELTVAFTETMLTLTAGSKEFDTIKETVNLPYIKATAKFGAWLPDVIGVVGDKIEVSAKDNYPLRIRENTPEMEVIYIIAPIVDNKEE